MSIGICFLPRGSFEMFLDIVKSPMIRQAGAGYLAVLIFLGLPHSIPNISPGMHAR
jgi:hypothetical protein